MFFLGVGVRSIIKYCLSGMGNSFVSKKKGAGDRFCENIFNSFELL